MAKLANAMQNKYWSALPLPLCVCVVFFFLVFFLRLDPLVLTKVLGSAPENNSHRSPLRKIFFISISAAVHRPKIGWQSGDILGSSDHRPMIGRQVADGKSWMYILRNYASILQMYTKQVILCNFINVIIVMKTSLIRQPFFYKKKVGFFFTFIHVVRISFDLFSPFTILKYNSTLTPDEQARFDRFQIVAFFQNRPTVCRSSGDHRLTLYRWESHEKRRIVQRNF